MPEPGPRPTPPDEPPDPRPERRELTTTELHARLVAATDLLHQQIALHDSRVAEAERQGDRALAQRLQVMADRARQRLAEVEAEARELEQQLEDEGDLEGRDTGF